MEDRPSPAQRQGHGQGWGLSPLPCSHLLELCLARYLSLHFFFFPKGLQLGESLWLGWVTLATRLPREEDTPMAQLSPQARGQAKAHPAAHEGDIFLLVPEVTLVLPNTNS